METKTSKPSGLLVVLSAGAVAVLGPMAGLLAEFRDFDMDLRMFRFMVGTNFVFFCVFLLPVTLGVLFIIRRKHFRPWLRTLMAGIPTLVVTLPYLVSGLVNPLDAGEAYTKRMDHPLPRDASDLRSWYFHGIGESHYMFSFQTTTDATDDLVKSTASEIVEHPAMLDPEIGMHFELPIGGCSVPKGWPRPKTWDGLQVYRSRQIKDYCYILTDASKTKVFVMVGDT